MTKKRKTMPPIHPGETLSKDFLKPLDLEGQLGADLCSQPATEGAQAAE